MSFQDLLAKPAETVEAPKPLPVGTYNFIVAAYEFGESGQKKTPQVAFSLTPISASADVDVDLLTAYGQINQRPMKQTYYLTEEALYRLTTDLGKFGLNMKLPISELIPLCVNKEIIATVTHTISKNDGRPYSNIGQIVGLAG
jgi:hypothetical protein